MTDWWWLSFGAPSPAMPGFLGVAIVESRPTLHDVDHVNRIRAEHGAPMANPGDWAIDLAAAIQRSWDLAINPGGALWSQKIPDKQLPTPKWRDRLLTSDEVNELVRQL